MTSKTVFQLACLLAFSHGLFVSQASTLTSAVTSKSSVGPKSSFFWRIDSSPPSYLFGTIHVPYTRVWDAVPNNAKMAFMHANRVFFELDLTDHGTITALSYCQLLPRGQHLSQLLPSDLYLRLKLHLEYVRANIPDWLTKDQKTKLGFDGDYLFTTITSNWERKRPIWVMMMVSTLTKADIASRGVPVLDLFLSRMAEKRGKKVGAIEKVEEQCHPLNALSPPKVIFALNQTLNSLDDQRLGITKSSSGDFSTDDLIEQYRNGKFREAAFNRDTFQIPVLSIEESKLTSQERRIAGEIDVFFREMLITKRNKRMAARVIDLLVNRPDTYFFAFGAGHFVGKDSILDFVEAAGFKVERVAPGDVLDFRTFTPSGGSQSNNNDQQKFQLNRVQGTFDDLPEHEKTRALLQFLQYHQQLERTNDTKQFEEMIGHTHTQKGGGAATPFRTSSRTSTRRPLRRASKCGMD